MATVITSECINCGACEPECPNTAIYQGGVEWQAPDGAMHPAISNDIFYIVPEKCTECVGFHDHEACAAVCPVDCCVPDPNIPETHDVLLARARALHPTEAIPDDAPSRFKKEGADAPKANGHDAVAAAAAAPAPAPAAKPVAAPAAKPAAAAAPQRVVGMRGRVEKAVPRPAAVARPVPSFAGELPIDFEKLLAELGPSRRRTSSRLGSVGFALLAVGQGILGALPAGSKQRIAATVNDRRFFDPALATAGNVFLNLLLYPIVSLGFAVATRRVDLFTLAVHPWIFLGLTIAALEAGFRLRESFFRGAPLAETPLRGAIYGPLLLPVGGIVRWLAGTRGAKSTVGFDGFSAGRQVFDEKLERERRYGSVYQLEDRDDAYILRVEFPRVLPPSTLADELGLAREMPDYEYQLSLRDSTFVVHGRVTDAQVRRLTAVAPAFPSEFTTRVSLRDPVSGFRHRYQDKTLEVILPKAAG